MICHVLNTAHTSETSSGASYVWRKQPRSSEWAVQSDCTGSIAAALPVGANGSFINLEICLGPSQAIPYSAENSTSFACVHGEFQVVICILSSCL